MLKTNLCFVRYLKKGEYQSANVILKTAEKSVTCLNKNAFEFFACECPTLLIRVEGSSCQAKMGLGLGLDLDSP